MSATNALRARRPDLSWLREQPTLVGVCVRDRGGAYVGEVAAVALASDGGIEAVDVESPAILAGRRSRRRLTVDEVSLKGGQVLATLFGREILARAAI